MPESAVETEKRLLDALTSLNQIGEAVNRIGPAGQSGVQSTLGLVVESATKLIPGSAAVIYIYDPASASFVNSSRVYAGDWLAPTPGIEPRGEGMGLRAIQFGRRIISYEEPGLMIHPMIASSGALTAACFPLIVADQPLGVLYVYINEERRFSQLEELVLENFVNHAAMALFQNQRFVGMQRDLERKSEELEHLRRAGLVISSRLRLEDTLEVILQMALDLTGAKFGIFRLVDKSGQNLVTAALAGKTLARPKVENLPVNASSVMSWVVRNRQPVCIADLHSPPWSSLYYPLDADLEMRSELAVPLIGSSGRMEGVLNLESPLVGGFSEQDSHLLQSLATQAVIAIQEVRLLDALQEAARLLLVLPPQQVLARLSDLACDLLNVDASVIWTGGVGRLSAPASCGREIISDASTAARAIEERSLVTVHTDSGWSIAAPLLLGESGEPLGAFVVYSSRPENTVLGDSDWDKKVLTCLAQYAALTVQNAAHQEALRQAQEQRAVAETFAVVGDVAANLLHQLNNKVGTIPVRIQGIQDKCQKTLSADRYLANNLAEIERSANEAMEAVRENLSHLRPIHLAEVSVQACVNAAVSGAALPESVEVRQRGLEALPLVLAGQRNLTLVFSNLLENAADAMHGEGEIEISGAARADWVEVNVRDSGPGISPELHDRIFELNYSGRNKAGRSGKLGFGLWWVRTLMARLGGSVSVESDGANGTTFHLKLPAAGGKS